MKSLKTISFYDWMITRQINKKSSIGDFARDMKDDTDFPYYANESEIVDYLLWECSACDNAIKAFRKAWKNYVDDQSIISENKDFDIFFWEDTKEYQIVMQTAANYEIKDAYIFFAKSNGEWQLKETHIGDRSNTSLWIQEKFDDYWLEDEACVAIILRLAQSTVLKVIWKHPDTNCRTLFSDQSINDLLDGLINRDYEAVNRLIYSEREGEQK